MMYEMKDQFENMISDIQSNKLKLEAYEELGLGTDAEPEQIKLAYKRLALKYHPDKHKNSQIAKEKFHKINESYICLVQSEGNSDIAEEMMCQFSTLFRYRVKTESGYVYFMSNPNGEEAEQENRGPKNHRGNEIKKKLKKKQELNEFRGKDNFDLLESPNELEIKLMKAKADKVAEELINEEDKAKQKAIKKREKKLRQREKKRQGKENSNIVSEIDFKKVEIHNGVKYEDQYSSSSEGEVKETVKLKPLQNGLKIKNDQNEKVDQKNLNNKVNVKTNIAEKKNNPKLGKILNGFHETGNKDKTNEKPSNNKNHQVQVNIKRKSKPENVNHNGKKSSKPVVGLSPEVSIKEKKKTAGNPPHISNDMESNKQVTKKDKNKIKNTKQLGIKSSPKSSSDTEEPAWDEHSAFFNKVALTSKTTKNKTSVINHIPHQPHTNNKETGLDDCLLRSKKLAMDGNELANKEKFGLAVEQFTRAILLHNKDFRYFGNRSFCFDRLNMFARALEDANTAISLNFNWPKGYFRRGRALTGLGRYIEAEDSFKKVLKLDKSSVDAEKELRAVQTKYLLDMGFSKSLCDIALKKTERMSEALDFLLSGALSESNLQDVYVSDEEDANFFENELIEKESVSKLKEVVQNKNNESSDDEEFKEVEYKSLWIGDLTPDVTERQLFDYFNQFGMVKSVNAMYARKCGFVNFYDTESTKNALLGGDNILIMNRNLIIRYPDRAFESTTSTNITKPITLVKNEPPAKSKRKECFYWRNRGCKFGDDCFHAHVPENAGIDIRPSIARRSLYD